MEDAPERASNMIGEYHVPIDPMDEFMCESCQ